MVHRLTRIALQTFMTVLTKMNAPLDKFICEPQSIHHASLISQPWIQRVVVSPVETTDVDRSSPAAAVVVDTAHRVLVVGKTHPTGPNNYLLYTQK